MDRELTWERPGQEDRHFKTYLINALARSGVCVALQDRNANYLFIANLFDDWRVNPGKEPTDINVFGEELGLKLTAMKQAALDAKDRGLVEDGFLNYSIGDRYFEFHVEALWAPGRSLCTMTTIIDLTEERRREQVLRTLLREVSHRTKNLMAIILSIASQTARHSRSLDQFLSRFRGRLFSLSQSQDLVTESSWAGAHFHDLVHQQLDKYIPDSSSVVRITGENVRLSPNAALHIGLALHELVVNAVSHGRIDSQPRPIEIRCERVQSPEGEGFEFVWREPVEKANGAEAPIEIARQFGSTVLERVVPSSVNGTAIYDISGSEIFYRLTVPRHAVEQ